jgi:CelD/BcsL family acetyltransferase involved in cellulose biosynthesis
VEHDPARISAWDRYVLAHPRGTIYHLSAWRTIFERSFQYRSWLLMARTKPTGEIAGVLPLYLVRTPFSQRLVSVPFRDRGGPLWDSPVAFDALIAEARNVATSIRARSVRLKTVEPYPKSLINAHALQEHLHWIHSLVDLRTTSAESLWKAMGDKNRNVVRKAENYGQVCEPLQVDETTVQKWHRLHLTTQKRLGVPPFPLVFFMTMAEELRQMNGIVIFGVRSGDRLTASAIVLLHGKTAIYGYSASDYEGHRLRANDLMVFSIIRWLLANGYDTFDLGSDSPRQESLLFFKRKWLAVQAAVPFYSFQGDGQAIIDSSDLRYAFARKAFALLPTRVLDMTGSVLTKYLG